MTATLVVEEQLQPARGRRGLLLLRRQVGEQYVALLAAQVVVAGVAAGVNVLAARALLPAGRGQIALLLQLGYLGSQLLLLGTERSFVAEFHGCELRVGTRAFARLLLLPAGVGLSVAGALAVVPLRAIDPWRVAIVVTAVFAVANGYVRGLRAVAIAATRTRTFLGAMVLSQLLLLMASAALFGAGNRRVIWWLLAYAVTSAVPVVFFMTRWAGGHDARRPRPPVDVRLPSVRRQGFALLPASLFNTGMLRFDRLLLPAMSSLTALGLYAGVATLTELLAWPAQAFTDARLGHWRAKWQRGSLDVTRLVLPVVAYVVIAAPLLCVSIYLGLVPLLGPAFRPARALVVPLVLAAACYALSRALLAVLVARRCNWQASSADGFGFLVSLVGYVVLIPRSGASGAAYASLFGYTASLLLAAALVRRSGATPLRRPRSA